MKENHKKSKKSTQTDTNNPKTGRAMQNRLTKKTKNAKTKTTKKPSADSLKKHPSLLIKLAKIQGREHPIDTASWLEKLTLSFVQAYINLASKVTITQRCHHSLPRPDQIFRTRDDLGLQLYTDTKIGSFRGGRRPLGVGDSDSGKCFSLLPRLRMSLTRAVFRAYRTEILGSIFLNFFIAFLDFGALIAVKYALDLAVGQISINGFVKDWSEIGGLLSVYFLAKSAETVFDNWLKFQRFRLSLRYVGGMSAILLEKIFKIGLENSTENTQKSIADYFKNDLMIFHDTLMYSLNQSIRSAINLPVGLGLGLYFFSWPFLALFGTIWAVVLLNQRLLKAAMRYYESWLIFVENRAIYLKNILANFGFVKQYVLENYALLNLLSMRKAELVQRSLFLVFWGLLNLLMILASIMGLLGFLALYLYNGGVLDVALVVVLARLFYVVRDGFVVFPSLRSDFRNLDSSVRRLKIFLESKQTESGRITSHKVKDSRYHILVFKGAFYWDKPLTEEESDQLRTEKYREEELMDQNRIKAQKKPKQKNRKNRRKNRSPRSKNKQSQLSANSRDHKPSLLTVKTTETDLATNSVKTTRSASLQQTLLSPDLTSDPDKLNPQSEDLTNLFLMEDVNFKAERSRVTMITGKSKSGKSSLLKAIIGEMRVADFVKSNVQIGGGFGYVGEEPWVFPGTVRENILVGRPFNELRYVWCLSAVRLNGELTDLDNGDGFEIVGDGGEEVSERLRMKITIARVLYQNPEIFLFDDFTKKLSPEDSTYIIDETILKQLRDKDRTIVMVTATTELLPFSDYLYIMEGGHVSQEGFFNIVKHSRPYQRMVKKENQLQQELERLFKLKNHSAFSSSLKSSVLNYEIKEISVEVTRKLESSSEQSIFSQTSYLSHLQHNSDLDKFFDPKRQISTSKTTPKAFHQFTQFFGGYLFLGFFVAVHLSSNLLLIYSFKYLIDWSADFYQFDPLPNFKNYGSILLAYLVLSFIKQLIKVLGTFNSSTRLHTRMMFGLLHAPLNPIFVRIGADRVVERVTSNLKRVDLLVFTRFYWFVEYVTLLISLVSAIGVSTHLTVWVLLGVQIYALFKVEGQFLTAKMQYERLREKSISPVNDTIEGILRGLSYIRTTKSRQYFRNKFLGAVNNRLKNDLILQAFKSWFLVRAHLIQMAVIQLPCLLMLVFLFKETNLADLGLFFFCGFLLQGSLGSALIHKSEWERSVKSVRRCNFFKNLEPEPKMLGLEKERKLIGNGGRKGFKQFEEYELAKDRQLRALLRGRNPQKSKKSKNSKNSKFPQIEEIITNGEIIVESLSIESPETGTNAINCISFKIKKGEKVAIFGRSNSGKEALLDAIWKQSNILSGKIIIDGTHTSKTDIKHLRAQIGYLGPKTAIFEGTLRQNLDPSEYRFRDQILNKVLDKLDFEHPDYKQSGLGMQVLAGGANLSEFEKVVIGLARCVLMPGKILLYNYPTKNIGSEIEKGFVVQTVRREFGHRTMLVLSDDMDFVLDCDRILVLKGGEIEAFGRPFDLMKKDGYFKQVVSQSASGV